VIAALNQTHLVTQGPIYSGVSAAACLQLLVEAIKHTLSPTIPV